MNAGAMAGVALLLLSGQDPEPARDRALARRVARAVDLFSTYTGRWPATLSELARRPADVAFWPEGGFWRGDLPDGVGWKGGTVTCGTQTARAEAPSRSAVVPPTERLRGHYSARVQLRLLRHAAEAYLHEHGRLPRSDRDLGGAPSDPWGKPIVFQAAKGRLRILVEGSATRQVLVKSLTAEERRALEDAGRPRVGEAERREIAALLDKLADDDLETREEASGELRRRGPVVGPYLREWTLAAADPEVRDRGRRLSVHFPELPPAWLTELKPLSTVVVLRDLGPALESSCANNLSQLWKMECVYMSQFGGRLKKMPDAIGKDFWLALARTKPPLVDETVFEIFVCPGSGEEAAAGACTYAGPAENVARLKDGDAVGLCDDEIHGDVVLILRKSGEVESAPRDGAGHEAALKTTRK